MNTDTLRAILVDQQEDAKKVLHDSSLIPRSQQATVAEFLRSNLIKVIMGIRRSGKSTLALQVLKDKPFLYMNFDDEVLAQLKVENLNELFLVGKKICPNMEYLILDEIQNIEGWELFVNKLHRKKINIVLTGSNSQLLSKELSTHLTGRQLNLELFPFSFAEFLSLHKVSFENLDLLTTEKRLQLESLFMVYLERGGFPELFQYPSDSRLISAYLKELYDKIISRDLVQRRHIKNIKALKEISLIILSHYATQFTYQSIKRVSSINSLNTVKNYIDYIQETYLGFVLEPFSHKVKERISLPKKFYSIDVALADVILGRNTVDRGRKLENLVCIELKRRAQELYYITTSSYEIDFAIRQGRQITHLIQVSSSLVNEKTKKREFHALLKGAEEFKVKNLTIITLNEEATESIGQRQVSIVPIWKWLAVAK